MNRSLTVNKVMDVFDEVLDRLGGRNSRDCEIGTNLKRNLQAWLQPSITHEMQDKEWCNNPVIEERKA